MTGAYLVAALIFFSLIYAAQLYFNRSFTLKIVNITVLVFISSAVYFTFETYKGWPTFEKQHSRAEVIAIVIEPPVKGKHEGGIYYWAVENKLEDSFFNRVFRYDPLLPFAPRAYFMPYTPELEKLFAKAQSAIAEGNKVFMEPGESQEDGSGQGANEGDADKKAKPGDGQSGSEKDYDVPTLDIITPDEYMKKND